MRVLVTGAAGFVGLHLVSELAAAGYDVIGLSRALPARDVLAGPTGKVKFVLGDVRDHAMLERLVAETRPTHIVHAAAITPSAADERERPREIVETNEVSTLTLLTAAARQGCERLLYFSSAAVYAEAGPDAPIPEDAPLRDGGGLYPLTKLASERLCRWAGERLGIDARSVRIGPVYGEHERRPTSSRQNMSPAYRAVALALRGETLRCNDALATWDWVHGVDVGRALLRLLSAPAGDLQRDTYNLAGEPVPMGRLLEAVAAVVPGTRVEWVATAGEANLPVPATIRRAPLDSTALARDTGYRPSYSIETGIRAYVEATRRTPDASEEAGR
jgi:nucleoside-diphosphate-sugar epimerase